MIVQNDSIAADFGCNVVAHSCAKSQSTLMQPPNLALCYWALAVIVGAKNNNQDRNSTKNKIA